jgi:hypothetical protein
MAKGKGSREDRLAAEQREVRARMREWQAQQRRQEQLRRASVVTWKRKHG